MTNKIYNHRFIEERSIALHALVAKKLSSNPSLINEVIEYTNKLCTSHPSSAFYFRKWLLLLHGDRDILFAKLVEDSEEMCAMRQSSPFSGVLKPKERWEIYENFRA